MRCPNCDAELLQATKFCPYCGNPMPAEAEPERPADIPVQETGIPVQQTPAAPDIEQDINIGGAPVSSGVDFNQMKAKGSQFVASALDFDAPWRKIAVILAAVAVLSGFFMSVAKYAPGSNWLIFLLRAGLLGIVFIKSKNMPKYALIPAAILVLLDLYSVVRYPHGWSVVIILLEIAFFVIFLLMDLDKIPNKTIGLAGLLVIGGILVLTGIYTALRYMFSYDMGFYGFALLLGGLSFIPTYCVIGYEMAREKSPDASWATAGNFKDAAGSLVNDVVSSVASDTKSNVGNAAYNGAYTAPQNTGASAADFDSAYKAAPAADQSYTRYPHPYHKLGGFLLAIVVLGYIGAAVMIIEAIVLLIQMNQITGLLEMFGVSSGAFTLLFVVMALLYLLIAAVLFVMLHKIRHKDHTFLRFYHIVCTVEIVLFLILIIAMYSFVKSIPYVSYVYDGNVGSMITSLILSIAVMVAYTVYFVKSVRVRTYMGSDRYIRLSPYTKNVPSPIPADTQPYTGNMGYAQPAGNGYNQGYTAQNGEPVTPAAENADQPSDEDVNML